MSSQRTIILLTSCLGVCLFALGFLLGRESNRAPDVAAPVPPVAVAAAAEPAPAEAPPVPTPIVVPPASPVVAAPAVAPAAATPPAAAARTITLPTRVPSKSASPPADDATSKEAVARYFHEVDRVQNVEVDNPEASAMSIIGAATSGDTSALRQQVAQTRDTEQKVRAITPPPPCAQYHQQLVSMLAESHSMLQRLEKAFAGGDLTSLPALLSQANGAKARSQALENEAREIKLRYGVAP